MWSFPNIKKPTLAQGSGCGKVVAKCSGSWIKLNDTVFNSVILICSSCKDMKCEHEHNPEHIVRYEKGRLRSMQATKELRELDESLDGLYYCNQCRSIYMDLPDIVMERLSFDAYLQFDKLFDKDTGNGLT